MATHNARDPETLGDPPPGTTSEPPPDTKTPKVPPGKPGDRPEATHPIVEPDEPERPGPGKPGPEPKRK